MELNNQTFALLCEIDNHNEPGKIQNRSETIEFTKANSIDLDKPFKLAGDSTAEFSYTQPTQNLTPLSVAAKQIKARMAIAEMVSDKSFDVYYAATEEIIEDMTNPCTPETDPA
jgi:cobyrinic acid a,c-diamide synthase